MAVSDTITGWVAPGGPAAVVMIDELSQNYDQPKSDVALGGALNVFDISGEQSGGSTTLQFTRLLVTGDPNDYWIGPKDVYLIWALGDQDGYRYVLFDKGMVASG